MGIEALPHGISQIGWDYADGFGYCRFWEYNNNSGTDTGPVDYDCGQDAGGTALYFEVFENQDPGSGAYHYGVFTCGTSGWSSCAMKSEGPLVSNFSNPYGGAVEESSNGGSPCPVWDMGSSANPVTFGGSGADAIAGAIVKTCGLACHAA